MSREPASRVLAVQREATRPAYPNELPTVCTLDGLGVGQDVVGRRGRSGVQGDAGHPTGGGS